MSEVRPDNLDEYLSAYLDDELADARRAEVESLLATDPAVGARLQAIRDTVERLRALPRRPAPPHMLDDLNAQMERRLLLGDEAPPLPGRSYRRTAISLLASAALVTITVGGGLWVFFMAGRPIPEQTVVTVHDTGSPIGQPSDRIRHVMPSETKGSRLSPKPAKLKDKEEAQDHFATERGLADYASDANADAPGVAHSDATEKTFIAAAESPSTTRLDVSGVADAASGLAKQDVSAAAKSALTLPVPRADLLQSLAAGGSVAAGVPTGRHEQADLAGKLAAGVALGEISRHPFDGESIAIDVTVNDEPDRQIAVARLVGFFAGRAIPELRAQVLLSFLGFGSAPNERSSFFIAGRAPENFPDARQQQFLVRIDPDRISDLLDAVADAPGQEHDVALTVGPLNAGGLDDARRLLAYAAPATAASVTPAREAGFGSREPVAEPSEPVPVQPQAAPAASQPTASGSVPRTRFASTAPVTLVVRLHVRTDTTSAPADP